MGEYLNLLRHNVIIEPRNLIASVTMYLLDKRKELLINVAYYSLHVRKAHHSLTTVNAANTNYGDSIFHKR
jgi:hypothetical protein